MRCYCNYLRTKLKPPSLNYEDNFNNTSLLICPSTNSPLSVDEISANIKHVVQIDNIFTVFFVKKVCLPVPTTAHRATDCITCCYINRLTTVANRTSRL